MLLVQVWESLNDSLRTEVKLSEGNNNNRVFSLPKKRLKDHPFMIHLYMLDKYGPEKYFVWYNNWYSTEDVPGDDNPSDRNIKNEPIEKNIKEDPKPLVVIRKQKMEISGPPLLNVKL